MKPQTCCAQARNQRLVRGFMFSEWTVMIHQPKMKGFPSSHLSKMAPNGAVSRPEGNLDFALAQPPRRGRLRQSKRAASRSNSSSLNVCLSGGTWAVAPWCCKFSNNLACKSRMCLLKQNQHNQTFLAFAPVHCMLVKLLCSDS